MRDDRSWYDTLQACVNGHVISSMVESHPEHAKKRCPECGAETITQCPACNAKIQGYHHIPGLAHVGDDMPAHCHECGNAYPWTEKRKNAGKKDNASKPELTKDVFVVHGRDEEMKQAVARTLSRLELNPVVLHEQPNHGRTLIEKFERNANVQFAVVLLSPDDMGFLSGDDPSSAKPRARQNVIIELGYFVGALKRERVFALKRDGQMELPSDFSGVVYTPYDSGGRWQFDLVRELKAAGYAVDANNIV